MGKGDMYASVFEEPATLREPAAPKAPREEPEEATDALLREILEEEPASASEPHPPAPSPTEEDWPAELHPLPLLDG